MVSEVSSIKDFWWVPLGRKIIYFQSITILDSVWFVLYCWALVSSGKTLAANAGGRGFEPHRGQNLFCTIYSIL